MSGSTANVMTSLLMLVIMAIITLKDNVKMVTERIKKSKPCPDYINQSLAGLVVRIEDLTPDNANARVHDDQNMRSIKASLKRFGQRAPIVVQKNGMVVRAGNGRLEAARQLGWEYIAAVIVDEDNLNATAFAIADNRTAELASWDQQVLSQMLGELISFDHDLAIDTGFNEAQIEAMIAPPMASDWSEEEQENQEDKQTEKKDKEEWQPTVGRIVLNYNTDVYNEILELVTQGIEQGLATDVSTMFLNLLREKLNANAPSEG